MKKVILALFNFIMIFFVTSPISFLVTKIINSEYNFYLRRNEGSYINYEIQSSQDSDDFIIVIGLTIIFTIFSNFVYNNLTKSNSDIYLKNKNIKIILITYFSLLVILLFISEIPKFSPPNLQFP